MLEAVKTSLGLDLFRLNYGFSNEGMGRMEYSYIRNKTIFYESGRYIYNLVASFLSVTLVNYRELREGSVFVFAATENQYSALKPVANEIKRSYIFNKNKKKNGCLKYDLTLAYILSLFYIPLLAYLYIKADSFKRKSIRKAFHNYLITYGYYLVSYKRLKKADPSLLLISNDHVVWSCGIARAAEELGIPVAYIQHASVTSNFPPLTYDFAFLYGRKTLEKYKVAGISSNTTVFLAGIPKLDEYAVYENNSTAVRTLGICTNRLDPVVEVVELLDAVQEKNSEIEFTIRPHPADERKEEWRKVAKKMCFKFSDSRREESFRFLKEVDAVIAGASGIHLEACLMNVLPIFFDFGDFGGDRYGFVETGMTIKAENVEEAVEVVSQLSSEKPDVKHKAKPYCETLQTEYFGKSSGLVGRIIEKVIDNTCSASGVNNIGEIRRKL
ncbi:hypothetical protein [Salinibacter altiplanensis]|uniref:hypothetical protein n=1 Tax=Salinibacter altiplanensis TaxID=1803181 RepID=UPI001300160B|nr:hypothetical protein [Salinibacter altiplanensis]